MIGLDTDVLVRYIAQDEPTQAALAARLIDGFTAEAPGFVSTVTLVETVWVLARAYKTAKAEILQVIEGLLRARDLVIEDSETHYLALNQFAATSIDYADAVIAQTGRRAGCEFTATFDRRAASGGMRLLEG
ncbi:type II toxin-antitoxin system VapC family toxin [Phenylobacterium sp. LjRoot225]|uniref:PIN domain-containing protein n=1 Tax=Phenylobacterium sp. LjRoot225 TaxID=3342285 RepID=UPI003ECD2803